MVLNIVTKNPGWVMQDLKDLYGEAHDIVYLGEVAKNIHEFSLTPHQKGMAISLEALLELGLEPWNIRIKY